MTKYQKRHRFIATFFLLIIFPTIFPVDLFASNNGPNSFEAASFEPIDASDMVNLPTGDMSYVLPLLNVPSPEGGYPLSLSNHAGIAMDQEASWVGLGWLLSPGAINRSANGYPDDIVMGNDNTLAYDEEKQLNFYDAGIGVNFNGITVGVGAYWGSNKSLGGSVALGAGPVSISAGAGTSGSSVGIGYSKGEGATSNPSTGIYFNSIKNQEINLSNQGSGINSKSANVTKNDYSIKSSFNVIGIGAGGFNFHYGRQNLKYSLYKEEINTYNGILYQFAGPNQKYDAVKLAIYDENSTNISNIDNLAKNYLCDNVLLPNYDNYKVQAQGLSGSITPTFTEEVKLSHEDIQSDVFTETDSRFGIKEGYFANNIAYATHNKWYNDPNYKFYDESLTLNTKIFFEFKNSNSSFLRIDRTHIQRNIEKESLDPNQSASDNYYRAYKHAKTEKTNNFNETTTTEGIPLKVNHRKRTGKHIEVFTNDQITSGLARSQNGFIEAKNLSRSQVKTYRPESIGGYQITDVDGKVYHYSLPVINYEIWYKNYSDVTNEDSQFIEKELNVPYATDWLLTAVTGPDYVDTNGNNAVDNEDYGYWVEFDYGKWTDGYIWNGNSGNFDVVKGVSKSADRYEYYRGRKQMYYLDAVRTRTHTAYFVKSVRQDAQSDIFANYKLKATNPATGFDKINNPKTYTSSYQLYEESLISSTYSIPNTSNNRKVLYHGGHKKTYRYADFPLQYSLKLDKIVLVKNDQLTVYKKNNRGTSLVPEKKGYLYENRGFELLISWLTETSDSAIYNLKGNYFSNQNTTVEEIPLHQDDAVIDVNDIANIDTSKAEKIINFQYDYSSMPNSFHSSATNKGKLTLNNVEFLGHGGVSCLPKYQFNYNNRVSGYNKENKDGWGYDKSSPANWSLSEIITPAGSKINIQYESDDYDGVASKNSKVFTKGIGFYFTKEDISEGKSNLVFTVSKNTDKDDNEIEDFTKFSDYFSVNESIGLDMFACRRGKSAFTRRETTLDLKEVRGVVSSVSDTTVTLKLPNNNDYWHFDDEDEWWLLNRNFSLTSVKHPNGNYDGVIVRTKEERECWPWRDAYSNDDVVFKYRLLSSRTPDKGKGGGIRVREISVSDGTNIIRKSKYYYNQTGHNSNPADVNYKSSGATSYVPSKEYMVLPYSSELPPPIVVYSNVSVEETNGSNELIGRTEYNFENLGHYKKSENSTYSMGKYFTVRKTQNEKITLSEIDLNLKKYSITDQISNIGRLNSITSYNANNQILYSLKNEYKIPNDSPDELGTKQESYLSFYNSPVRQYNVNSVSKIWYPNQLVKTSITQGGHTQSTTYNKFDFLTGDVVESTTSTSDGQIFKNKIIPAYTKQSYTSMGAKADNSNINRNNKNMLTQVAANYSYFFDKTDNAKPWKETNVAITTWNNFWVYSDVAGTKATPTAENEKIWRKHKSYTWNGAKDANGIFMAYNTSNDDNFNWTTPTDEQQVVQNNKWRQVSEITLYDHFSNPLEIKDVNNNYSTSKTNATNTKVIAAGNGRYNEIFFSGAENAPIRNFYDYLEPEVILVNAVRNSSVHHTGVYSVEATANSKFGVTVKNTRNKINKYKISVWVEKTNASKARINSNGSIVDFTETYNAGNWVLKSGYVNVPIGDHTIFVTSADNSKVYFDDLMVRPVFSVMTGYVYDEWDQLSYVIKNNGLATKIEYDAAGRVVKTYSEILDDAPNGIIGGFKIAKSNTYNNKYL